MKRQSAAVLIALASFSVAAEMRRILTRNPDAPANLNPSQAIPPINPSQAIPPINPSQSIPPVRTPSSPGRTGAPPAPDDRPLTVKVWVAIMRGPGVPVDGLLVETDRGRVILRGAVRSEADKAEAGARAEALAGQGNVVNRLRVSSR